MWDLCGLVLVDMIHVKNNAGYFGCCYNKNEVKYWDCKPFTDLPIVSVKYPDHEYDDLKEIYCLDDDFDPYFAPSNYGSYSELCNQLQKFISAGCFAVTIENDEPNDPKYTGITPNTLYNKKQWKTPPSAVTNRDSLEILFNTYLYQYNGSYHFTYQQKIMNNVIREKLYTSIHHNFLCEVIRTRQAKLIKIYMFPDAPFAVHIRYNPSDKVFSVSLFRSIDHIEKYKSKEQIDRLIATPLDDNGDNEEDAELGDSLPIPQTSKEELDSELSKIELSRNLHLLNKMIDF